MCGLGAAELPDCSWTRKKGETEVSLRVGHAPLRLDFNAKGRGGSIRVGDRSGSLKLNLTRRVLNKKTITRRH